MQAHDGELFRRVLSLSVIVGTKVSTMCSAMFNMVIPQRSQHFTLGPARVQQVSSDFRVAMTFAMLTAQWLLARYGSRSTNVGCMLLLLLLMLMLMLLLIGSGLANDFSSG